MTLVKQSIFSCSCSYKTCYNTFITCTRAALAIVHPLANMRSPIVVVRTGYAETAKLYAMFYYENK